MLWNMTLTLSEPSEWHSHDVFELVFCLSGTGQLLIEQQQIELTGRRTILVAPKARHRYIFRSGESANLKILCATEADMAAYLSPAQASFLSSIRNSGSTFTDHPKQDSRLWGLIGMLPDGLTNEDQGQLQVSWGIIGLLLALHNRGQQMLEQNSETKHFRTIQEICKWLDGNLENTGDLDRISHRFGLSRSLLTREFRRITNLSIIEYINIRRIQKAGAILSRTDKSITETAFESGFPSIANFYRKFKALYGVTPAQFRSQFFKNALNDN